MAHITLILLLCTLRHILVQACFPEPYRRQSRARSFNDDNDINVIGPIFTLHQGASPNLSLRAGQDMYGRLTVPWTSSADLTVEVLAHWANRRFSTTPLWLYIKKGVLPTTTNFDKTGVSFTSRQFSRVRLHEAEQGATYFVLVEAMQDIRNLTMEVKFISTEESTRTSFQDWPRRLAIP